MLNAEASNRENLLKMDSYQRCNITLQPQRYHFLLLPSMESFHRLSESHFLYLVVVAKIRCFVLCQLYMQSAGLYDPLNPVNLR